jgi:hypothetical protein
MDHPPPGPEELRAYAAGALPPERFAAVDRWLAGLDDDAAERALAAAGVDGGPGVPLGLPPVPAAAAGFASELPRGRLRPGPPLGSGGMAVVSAAHDRVLERTVAVKVLRARGAGEGLEPYHLRAAAFRREAALTAALEHPAIPPVYDVGSADGQPAFVMRRLEGRPFGAVVEAGLLPLADRLAVLLRVAEAVAFAHSRGVVHRDLSAANILVADFGAVYVLDWGLAAQAGSGAGVQAGTPGFMAPEQSGAAPADARMDVFALGALAFLAVTGQPLHRAGDDAPRLDLLEARPVPAGIAALVRRCLAPLPADRYPDAGAVADELHRWFAEGITLAQQATLAQRTWLRLRRSPRARAALAAGLAAALLAGGGWWLSARRAQAEAGARIAELAAGTPLGRAATVAVALDEVRAIARRHPGLAAAGALQARLQAAHDLALGRERDEAVQARLAGLLRRTRTHGPWADQVQAWREAIRDAGLGMDPARVADDVRALAASPLRPAILEALAFLWRAEKERGADHRAEATAALLAAAGTTPGWQALGRLLQRTRFAAHDPVFCACDDSEGTLTEAAPTAVALALFAPEPRLAAAARAVLAGQPGDFWPLVASARASLADGDAAAAERLALVASGAEPASLLPPLLLGYAALQRGDQTALAAAVARGLAVDPASAELLALQAVALVRAGRRAQAQAVVDRLPAGHLQYHLRHRVGHPMEASVQALADAGLLIPAAAAELGPLSPHQH